MAFLTILLVLFIDRVLWDGSPYREHTWFHRYLDRINAGRWLDDRSWGAPAAILPLLLLLGWLQISLFPMVGEFFEFALATGVLLLSIGPRDLGRDTDDYLEARHAGDKARTAQLAERFASDATTGADPDNTVSNGILAGACQRLIGPLFWFALFGVVGAAAYRLSHLLSERLLNGPDPLSPLARSASAMRYVLDWAPIRVTAAGYAVAGNFDAVAAAWKQCSQLDGDAECPSDEAMLVATGHAALEQSSSRPTAALIEDSLALVWRNLTLWVVFIGAVTLFGAL